MVTQMTSSLVKYCCWWRLQHDLWYCTCATYCNKLSSFIVNVSQ